MLRPYLAHFGEEWRGVGLGEVGAREDEVLVVVLGPQRRPLGEREERQVDDERGEVVNLAREEVGAALGVLVVLVPDLARLQTCERRDEHAVEVNQS